MNIPKGSGIYFDKNTNLYHARIYRKGRNFHIGRFKTPEEALQQRKKHEELLNVDNKTIKQPTILQA